MHTRLQSPESDFQGAGADIAKRLAYAPPGEYAEGTTCYRMWRDDICPPSACLQYTIQYNTIQYNTIQYNYNTIQYNTQSKTSSPDG